MYLKIKIDGDEKLYSFPGINEISIGRSPHSDIQLLVEGISRDHSRVIHRNDEFFYIDVGSSRGSFINENKLEVNVESSFNSFFPIRLGESVNLYLMDEVNKEDLEEAVQSEENQIDINEQVLKPKEIKEKKKEADPKKKHKPMIYVPESAGKVNIEPKKKRNTESLESKKNPRNKRTLLRGKRKKKVDHNQRILVFLFVLIIFGFFGNRKYQEFKVKENERTLKIEKQKKAVLEKQKKERIRLSLIAKVKKEKIRANKEKEFLMTSISKDKCLSDIEATMCSSFKSYKSRSLYEGYVKSFSNLIVVIDIDSLDLFLQKKYQTDYDEANLVKLTELAKKEMGRSFHFGYFRNKMNLVTKELVKNKKYYNSIMLIDVLDSGLIGQVQSVSGIGKISLVAMKDNKYSQHINLDFNKIKNYKELENANFAYKVYLRSSISKPLERILSKIVFKPLLQSF